jgi:hypothetical protein
MRCDDKNRGDGSGSSVPVPDERQQAHKNEPNTRRPSDLNQTGTAHTIRLKAAGGLGRSPIGAEGTVHSCLVPLENNRNKQEDWNLQHFQKGLSKYNSLGRNKYCGAYTVEGRSASETKYVRVNCKCWDCPYCGPRRAKLYRARIRSVAEEHRLNRFLTLTLDPKKIEGDPIKYLRECFNEFRVYLHRRFGRAIKYIAVVELQKNGNPHLHILLEQYIEQAWIKHTWQAVGGGFKVDIRFVDVHRVSRYVSKYLTQELLISAPKGTRRITCSRTIKLLEKLPKTHSWKLYKTPIFHLYGRLFVIAVNPEFDDEKFLKSFAIPIKREVSYVSITGT